MVFYAKQNFANRMYDMQDASAQKKVYHPDADRINSKKNDAITETFLRQKYGRDEPNLQKDSVRLRLRAMVVKLPLSKHNFQSSQRFAYNFWPMSLRKFLSRDAKTAGNSASNQILNTFRWLS